MHSTQGKLWTPSKNYRHYLYFLNMWVVSLTIVANELHKLYQGFLQHFFRYQRLLGVGTPLADGSRILAQLSRQPAVRPLLFGKDNLKPVDIFHILSCCVEVSTTFSTPEWGGQELHDLSMQVCLARFAGRYYADDGSFDADRSDVLSVVIVY